MLLLTEDARLACDHGGGVDNMWSQEWVRIAGRRVLVAKDPEGRDIDGCPNTNPAMGLKPCTTTLKVAQGYSGLMTVNGRRVCLDSISGLTNGSPPGLVRYVVHSAGQGFVRAKA